MVVITEPPPNIVVVDGSSSGGLYEGTRTMAQGWRGNSQVGSPTLCCFSESDRSVQGSVEPLDRKVEE